ncbi:MAG: acyl-CoA dehydrogenase family protein [Gemmatimonadota bacterium]
MRLALTPDQVALRDELRAFLDMNLPPDHEEGPESAEWAPEAEYAWVHDFNRRLGAAGWLVPHWPVEYGGRGLGIIEQVVVREELAYRRAPLINPNGLNMLGPILMREGTDEQKARHLPGIASADVIWAQGYSEPNAGSDLAALQMRAERNGDHYVLNGQKTWTSCGMRADWMFLLARTSKETRRQDGISFLLVDMRTPGIEIRPIASMTGTVTFAEEFFTDVRVPVENRVGAEGDGWRVGKALLTFERSNIARAARERRILDDLIAYCRSLVGTDRDPLEDPVARLELGRMIERVEVGRAICYRLASMQAEGRVSPEMPSISKLYHSEFAAELVDVGSRLLGEYGNVMPGDAHCPARGQFSLGVMKQLLHKIGAGTSEIQRDLIARTGAKLPRA